MTGDCHGKTDARYKCCKPARKCTTPAVATSKSCTAVNKGHGFFDPNNCEVKSKCADKGNDCCINLRLHDAVECKDGPSFNDVRGWNCASWNNYNCYQYYGYSVSDLDDVRRNCPATCGTCQQENKGIVNDEPNDTRVCTGAWIPVVTGDCVSNSKGKYKCCAPADECTTVTSATTTIATSTTSTTTSTTTTTAEVSTTMTTAATPTAATAGPAGKSTQMPNPEATSSPLSSRLLWNNLNCCWHQNISSIPVGCVGWRTSCYLVLWSGCPFKESRQCPPEHPFPSRP